MISGNVTLECDNCGEMFDDDLEKDQTPQDVADREGWMLTGTLLDRLLCPGLR